MKIDLKLLKKILEKVEGKPDLEEEEIFINGYDPFIVGWHCNQLIENELVKGILSVPMKGILTPVISEITIKGTDFLRALQNDTLVNKVKRFLKSLVFSAASTGLKGYIVELLKKSPNP